MCDVAVCIITDVINRKKSTLRAMASVNSQSSSALRDDPFSSSSREIVRKVAQTVLYIPKCTLPCHSLPNSLEHCSQLPFPPNYRWSPQLVTAPDQWDGQNDDEITSGYFGRNTWGRNTDVAWLTCRFSPPVNLAIIHVKSHHSLQLSALTDKMQHIS